VVLEDMVALNNFICWDGGVLTQEVVKRQFWEHGKVNDCALGKIENTFHFLRDCKAREELYKEARHD